MQSSEQISSGSVVRLSVQRSGSAAVDSFAMAYSSSGRLAFAAITALWVWAASTAFVSSNTGSKALRGVERSSNAEYAPFPATAEMGEQQVRSVNSGMQAVLLAAVVGLMAGLAPVRAEEAAPAEAPTAKVPEAPSAEDESNFLKKSGGKDAGRMTMGKSKARKSLKKEKAAASGVVVSDDEGKPKRVIISPADDLDEDELSPTRPNQPLLFLIYATPVTIYLTFYVLGSLNIIWVARRHKLSTLLFPISRTTMTPLKMELLSESSFTFPWFFLGLARRKMVGSVYCKSKYVIICLDYRYDTETFTDVYNIQLAMSYCHCTIYCISYYIIVEVS